MNRVMGRLAATAALLLAQASFASAAEIKVYSTIGVKSALEELIPVFEKASGHKLNMTWSTGTLLAKRIHDGETADVLIATPKDVEDLVKEGKIAAGSPTVLSAGHFCRWCKERRPETRHLHARSLQTQPACGESHYLHQSGSRRAERRLFCKATRSDGHSRTNERQDEISAGGRFCRRFARER